MVIVLRTYRIQGQDVQPAGLKNKPNPRNCQMMTLIKIQVSWDFTLFRWVNNSRVFEGS